MVPSCDLGQVTRCLSGSWQNKGHSRSGSFGETLIKSLSAKMCAGSREDNKRRGRTPAGDLSGGDITMPRPEGSKKGAGAQPEARGCAQRVTQQDHFGGGTRGLR